MTTRKKTPLGTTRRFAGATATHPRAGLVGKKIAQPGNYVTGRIISVSPHGSELTVRWAYDAAAWKRERAALGGDSIMSLAYPTDTPPKPWTSKANYSDLFHAEPPFAVIN